MAGLAVALEPRAALLLVAAQVVAFALVGLRGAALAWLVMIVVALPYYDLQQGSDEAARIPEWLIPGLGFLAVAAPWAWSLARGGRVRRPPAGVLLFTGVVLILLALSLTTVGVGALAGVLSGAFFAGTAAFLCARRVGRVEDWCPSAAAGLLALLAVAGVAFLAEPEGRLGSFTGYPILFAGLVVGLLPPALAYLYPRSRLLAFALAAASVTALIFSETRSAWLAAAVVLLVGMALLVRFGKASAALLVAMLSLALAALVMSSGALSTIVEERLSEESLAGESVTHRRSVYGYTAEKVLASPVVGERAPGESKAELDLRRGINAADNGFLALASDLGLLGLSIGLVPLVVALRSLRAFSRRAEASFAEISVTLGLVGLCVVTVFFDTYYWLQSSLLLFGFAGALYAHSANRLPKGRVAASARLDPARARS